MMKTPRFPIAWELWRKNRWGFALLFLLLVAGIANAQWVAALHREAETRYEPYRSKDGPAVVMIRRGSAPEAPETGAATNFSTPVPSRDARTPLTQPEENAGSNALRTNLAAKAQGRMAYGLTVMPSNNPVCPDEVAELVAHSVAVREAVFPWCVWLLVFSLLAICTIFGAAEPNSVRGFTGLPPRQFTLPRKTRSLVAWPMGLGVVAILAVYHAWSWLVFQPMRGSAGGAASLTTILFLSQGSDAGYGSADALLDVYYSGLLPMGLIWFQTLVWGMASFPKRRAWAIVGLMSVWGLLAFLPFKDAHAVDASPLTYLGLTVVYWILGVIGVRCAHVGVARERCGTWQRPERGAVGTVENLWPSMSKQGAGFRTPLRAQVWIEWRRNARFAIGAWFGIAALWVTVCLLKLKGEPIALHMRDLDLLFVGAAIPWLVISGLNLARDGSNGKLAMGSFTATKPIRAGTVLLAKLLAGLALWLAVAVPFVLFGLGVRMVTGETGSFGSSELVVTMVVMLHLTAGILPLCLSGRIPGFPWSLLPVCLVYGACFTAVQQGDKLGAPLELALLCLAMMVAFKICASFFAFWVSIKRRLVTPGFVLGYGIGWVILTSALVVLALRSLPDQAFAERRELYVVLMLALLAVPLTRIALSPLALSWNRHR